MAGQVYQVGGQDLVQWVMGATEVRWFIGDCSDSKMRLELLQVPRCRLRAPSLPVLVYS